MTEQAGDKEWFKQHLIRSMSAIMKHFTYDEIDEVNLVISTIYNSKHAAFARLEPQKIMEETK